MVAIKTEYHGPTNYKGARIIAQANGHRVIISADDSLSAENGHKKAAYALRDKMGWKGELVGGLITKANGDTDFYAWVFLS